VNIKEWINGTAFSLPVPMLPWVSVGRWHSVVWDAESNAPKLDADGNVQSIPWISWIDIPTTAVLLAVVAAVLWFAINRTIFGRYLLALGNNVQAARFSGISTDKIIISTYVICSLLAGLTGILLVFDFNTIEPSQTGSIYEMYAVAAAVIGGCSLRGGSGSIVGVVVGTAVTRSLFLSIAALSIPKSWEYIIIALALLAAVLTDELIRIFGNQRKLRAQARLAKSQS
jgi:ribose transport system permease protein